MTPAAISRFMEVPIKLQTNFGRHGHDYAAKAAIVTSPMEWPRRRANSLML